LEKTFCCIYWGGLHEIGMDGSCALLIAIPGGEVQQHKGFL
jgi:hypothetical protein